MDFDDVKLLIEEFFNGKFEVKKSLGEGSFAKVYLVYHNYLDTLMAMKVIKEPLNAATNKKDTFREVTLACQLRHENIISIYDAAEITNFEDGKNHAYFVMEYVSGGDLERFLNSFSENNMFMPIGRSLDLIRQILSGLNTLHSANPPIIHRDLKPNNVLLSFNDTGEIIIKISDFGFAKEVSTSISDIDIAGTRPYMSPELFNKSVSTRSDIYAVGVIFYQLLTNRYPYNVDEYTNDELIDLKPWTKSLRPPSYYNEQVLGCLDEIVLKCLSVDPDERYRDAGELLDDVERAIDKFNSTQFVYETKITNDYRDEYNEYVINDSIKEAFRLAKRENGLADAIEILEREVLQDYDVRRCYSETLRMWKSKRPDLKLISKAFTINLKGKYYKLSCNFLREALAYNPSLKSKYQHYLDLWEIFIDLERNGSLFRAVASLENLMESSGEIKKIYKNILPTLKTYSVTEIAAEAVRQVHLNNLSAGANLMEFAVVCDFEVRQKYEYKLSLWKQNMKMHFRPSSGIKRDTIDFAIDLGTTDSMIAYYNNGNPAIIKNHRTGDDFTPSAILVDKDDNVEVGFNARKAIFENNNDAASGFKHDMGFSIPFKFENSSRVMFPEELSAEVLKDLRVSVYGEMGINIEHAVICVPANSNPMKTRAINDAAEIAGFRSCNLILEPIAVSLAYGLEGENGTWMIYDLGGGTFNVTLIRDNNGEIEKVATDGFENFGGYLFDLKIVNELLRPKIAYELNLDDFRSDNPKYFKAFAKLKIVAETAKNDLTHSEETDIFISELFDGYDFRYTLTRERFGEIIEPLMDDTFRLSRTLLEENALSDYDLDKIILVGGSCLNPVVRECIENEFDIEIELGLDPLTVVSKGAAIYAGGLEKPRVSIKKQLFSAIINQQNDEARGIVFCQDLKFSFLGFNIEFENDNDVVKVPLTLDGTFKVKLPSGRFNINIYKEDVKVDLDEKSPDILENESIHIPYFDSSFASKDEELQFNDLFKRYFSLINDVEYLSGYSYEIDKALVDYISRLIKLSNKNGIAFNQTNIYLKHLEGIVGEFKRDLEFSILEENVLEKINVVKNNKLFKTDDLDEILQNRDLEKLKEYHSRLIKKYVLLNRNTVIEECFFNLKLEGIYSDERQANELIENAEIALADSNYSELFKIVNRLYELDERG